MSEQLVIVDDKDADRRTRAPSLSTTRLDVVPCSSVSTHVTPLCGLTRRPCSLDPRCAMNMRDSCLRKRRGSSVKTRIAATPLPVTR